MDDKGFKTFLKRGGRSQEAIERCVNYVILLEEYLKNSRENRSLVQIKSADLIDFVNWADSKSKTQAKTKSYLWAIRYYYEFMENSEISMLAGNLRQERIKRKPFLLKDFQGIDKVQIENLQKIGIRNIEQMCAAGATAGDRERLADRTGIPLSSIVKLVKLSDLARLPGVKAVRARLYFEAGIDTVEKIAVLEPEELREKVETYINQSDFPGVPTLPAEARYTVEKARELPKIIEY
ncbi:MAG: DUF4332 domain-containing protein [Anaerolineales bacterium]